MGRKVRNENEVSSKPAAGATRFGVLILQINLEPHAFSHMQCLKSPQFSRSYPFKNCKESFRERSFRAFAFDERVFQ